jgi:hypothetical protein
VSDCIEMKILHRTDELSARATKREGDGQMSESMVSMRNGSEKESLPKQFACQCLPKDASRE